MMATTLTALPALAFDPCHLALARRIARAIARSHGPWAPVDELEGAALVGLAEAYERFDPSRRPSFESYLSQRVRGSVLDELRRLDPRPRRVRAAHCRAAAARDRLRARTGCEPSAGELASELGESPDTAAANLAATAPSFVPFEDWHADSGRTEIVAELDRASACASLRASLDLLDERSRRVLELYFFEELSQREIGHRLAVTESRVCQIKSRALRSLRAALS